MVSPAIDQMVPVIGPHDSARKWLQFIGAQSLCDVGGIEAKTSRRVQFLDEITQSRVRQIVDACKKVVSANESDTPFSDKVTNSARYLGVNTAKLVSLSSQVKSRIPFSWAGKVSY